MQELCRVWGFRVQNVGYMLHSLCHMSNVGWLAVGFVYERVVAQAFRNVAGVCGQSSWLQLKPSVRAVHHCVVPIPSCQIQPYAAKPAENLSPNAI